MKPNILEILLFSEGIGRAEMTAFRQQLAEWVEKIAFPALVKQEKDTKRLALKTMTDTPAIYMS